jgi:hypothetical protein
MAKITAKTTAAAKPANVFAKPAPAAVGDGEQAPVADVGQGAPVADEGADFSIDGEDEVQKEEKAPEQPIVEKPAEEAKPAKAPKPTPAAKKAVAPSIDGEDEIREGGASRAVVEAARNAEAEARLRQSQNEAVENAQHIARLSKLGSENTRRIRLEKLSRTESSVRELIAENEALKAENAALKKK